MVRYKCEVYENKDIILQRFLDAAKQFCEDFKEEVEKEKEEYLEKKGMFI